jgi:hypothetical protein
MVQDAHQLLNGGDANGVEAFNENSATRIFSDLNIGSFSKWCVLRKQKISGLFVVNLDISHGHFPSSVGKGLGVAHGLVQARDRESGWGFQARVMPAVVVAAVEVVEQMLGCSRNDTLTRMRLILHKHSRLGLPFIEGWNCSSGPDVPIV